MKHATRVAALVVFAACAVFSQQSAASSRVATDLREINRLEDDWNTINEVSDAEGKRRLLADDSYHVGPSGRLYDKSQDIAAARLSYKQKQASHSTLKFVITDKKIRLYADVAVVTATGWSVTTRDGQERRGNSFRVVHVWEKRGGRWQIVVDQVTRIAA